MSDEARILPPGYVGPKPDDGARCACKLAAVARCDGCGESFCRQHWWKHSHAKERPNETQRD
jgi:hypothetical protein